MLTPRAYRAALLDQLTTSPAEVLPADTAGDAPSHARDAEARPALRLARTSAPPQQVPRGSSTHAERTTASSAGSHSVMRHVVESPARAPWTPVDQHGSGALPQRVAHAITASAHTCAAPGIAAEQNRSIILSFIDACNASGVPETVIAEQVQFMVSSMKESLALHAALHARQHKDRIREYELEELAATLERQQLQFNQHLQQAAVLARPRVAFGDPALMASRAQPQLPPPPPLAYVNAAAPSVAPHAAPEVSDAGTWREASEHGARAFRYASLTQRSSPNAAVDRVDKAAAPATASPAGRHSGTSSAGPADHQAPSGVPVSTWHPRASARSSPSPAERTRTGMRTRAANGTAAPPYRTTQPPARTSQVQRTSACRHGSHHKLCNVCYAAAASATPHVSFTDAGATAANGAGTRNRRTRYTPHQNYMRPTHASLARRGPSSHSTSPRRDSSPTSPASDGVRADAGDSPWQGSQRGTNASATTAHADHVYNSAAPRRLLVRSTLSSRLRAAQAAQPHVEPSRASSRVPTPHRSRSAHAEEATPQPRAPRPPARTSVPRVDPWSHFAAAVDAHDGRHHAHGDAVNRNSGFVFPAATASSTSATDSGSDVSASRAVMASTGSGIAAAARVQAAHAARPHSATPGHREMSKSQSGSSSESTTGEERAAAAAAARRPRRPPPSVVAAPAPPPVVLVVDMDRDAVSDVPVCVTSPELQLFLERSQRKLREAERVLTRQQQPSSTSPHEHVKSVSRLTQSPSPIVAAPPPSAAAVKPVSSRGQLDSTATTFPTPTQPSIFAGDAAAATTANAVWSAHSLDGVRARQQQRLAELHRRLSAYETTSFVQRAHAEDAEDAEDAVRSRHVRHGAGAAALAEEAASRSLSPTASSVFRPHYVAAAPTTAAAAAHVASLGNSPLVQISPTSSDEDSEGADG